MAAQGESMVARHHSRIEARMHDLMGKVGAMERRIAPMEEVQSSGKKEFESQLERNHEQLGQVTQKRGEVLVVAPLADVLMHSRSCHQLTGEIGYLRDGRKEGVQEC